MLSARAYSFRQKSRLAISLSWIGGYTNVVLLLSCGTLVSHATGTVTQLGHAIGSQEFLAAGFFIFLVASFFVGAVTSALMTEGARRWGKPSKYVMPIAAELFLLTLFGLGYEYHTEPMSTQWRFALTGVAAVAMGLQNATITKISGAVVRTTHLTGVVTDLGLEGVQFLYWWFDRLRDRWATRTGRIFKVSQRHPSFLRLLLLASIFCSFLVGATAGTVVFAKWPEAVMFPPSLFLFWLILSDLRSPIADVRELDLLSDPELQAQGIVKALLPPELGIYRSTSIHVSHKHRAPNFQLWVDGLPAHLKVVILAVSPATLFDANAVLDLEAAVARLHANGRKLIICGVSQTQVRSLAALGVARIMDTTNLSPDLEFAIARGMALIHQMQWEDRRAYGATDPSRKLPLPVGGGQ